MNPNRKFHELVGLCWCEPEYFDTDFDKCPKCGAIYSRGREFTYHPDYAADPRLVLWAMEVKHPDFIETIFSIDEAEYHSYRPEKRRIVFDKFIGHILDTTGKLRDAAIKFMRKEAP